MTTRADYTDEEWETLKQAPVQVGVAVMAASPGGLLHTVEEYSALLDAIGKGVPSDTNELVRALAAEAEARELDWAEEHAGAMDQQVNRGTMQAEALESCQRAAAILAAKTSDAEAEGYKRWLLLVGQHVAEAAKEGGVLGIGGRLVSREEDATLNQVAAALGISR